jgi:hypothetical protein
MKRTPLYSQIYRFTLALILLTVWLFPTFATAQATRIVCLGNSITQADENHKSYRYFLWKQLIDANIDFEYVGSHNENKFGAANPAQNEVYKGKTFTNVNEAHWGWRTDEILNGQDDYYPYGTGLETWLQDYIPDMALIHLGTNDIFQGQNTSETIGELKEVIRLLRNNNPQVTILLAQLVPTGKTNSTNDTIQVFNNKIGTLGSSLTTANSNIIVVDQYTGFDGATDTYDEVHTNESGERKMAQRWFEAIQQNIGPLPVTLTSFTARLTNTHTILLNWQTASEKNNARFEIQRSTDSAIFKTIANINGAGTTQTISNYRFEDDSIPATGSLYYRLRQVDIKGKASLSQVVQVILKPAPRALAVYPTIASGSYVNVELHEQQPLSQAEVLVYNNTGKQVIHQSTTIDENGKLGAQIDTSLLQDDGLYFVRVLTGSQTLQAKFILRR